MYQYQISDMVQSLVSTGLISTDRILEATQVLSSYWSDKIVSTWSVEDVLGLPEAKEHNLTEEDALIILSDVQDNFDAGVGINWTVLEFALFDYLRDNTGEE